MGRTRHVRYYSGMGGSGIRPLMRLVVPALVAGVVFGMWAVRLALDLVPPGAAHVPTTGIVSAYSADPSPTPSWHTTTATVRAIYVTAATAKNPQKLGHLMSLIERTILNAMVIDVKGDTPYFDEQLQVALQRIVEAGIYPIARIVIFKDNGFARENPSETLKYAGGSFWRDSSGATWLDPASRASWAYMVHQARRAADMGFREINLDYVRFPTDGTLSAIRYPVWDGKTSKIEIIAAFFAYFNTELKKTHPNIKTSLDIFGYTFLTSSGLNIGQRMEDAVKHFDYIAPMVYPSHYSAGNFGVDNPAAHPHLVITKTLEKGFEKLPAEYPRWHIRPWLQAFNLGADYNAHMLHEQIRALKDSGITEFYLWNAYNIYDRYESALREPREE